MENIKL